MNHIYLTVGVRWPFSLLVGLAVDPPRHSALLLRSGMLNALNSDLPTPPHLLPILQKDFSEVTLATASLALPD